MGCSTERRFALHSDGVQVGCSSTDEYIHGESMVMIHPLKLEFVHAFFISKPVI